MYLCVCVYTEFKNAEKNGRYLLTLGWNESLLGIPNT